MKKYLKLLIVILFMFVLYSFNSLSVEELKFDEKIYNNNFYDERIASAYVEPKITNVELMGNDLVKLTLTKGSHDFTEIVFLGADDISQTVQVPVTNGSTTQYASVKNGTYKVIIQDTTAHYTTYSEIITIDTSCNNEFRNNATGVVEFERCLKYAGVDGEATADLPGEIVPVCASGYVLKTTDYNQTITSNSCASYSKSDLTNYGVGTRYCSMNFKYECIKSTETNSAKLKSLTVDNMSPTFNPNTYSYSATTTGPSISIGATLNDDGSSFVEGYGPRAVNLSIGVNTFYVKVKSTSGNITTYTVNITRTDQRDTVNTLSSLSIGSIPFNETFNPNTNSYSVRVDESVEEVYVNAELTSDKSTFLEGFEPRRVTLKDGVNGIYVKVKSESGSVRIYTIEVRKGTTDDDDTGANVFLENIRIETDDDSIVLKPSFQEDIFQYNLTVPFDVTLLLITGVPKDREDIVEIIGNENYEVGDNLIQLVVTDHKTEEQQTYEIHLNRMEKNLDIGTDSSLKELEVENVELSFDKDTLNYNLRIEEGEKELVINAVPNSERASVEIIDNVDLKVNSEIVVRVNAEDGTFTDYVLFIEGYKQDINIFLIVLIILIIVLALVYLVLRMLGYKIVINTDTIKGMFKSKKKKRK